MTRRLPKQNADIDWMKDGTLLRTVRYRNRGHRTESRIFAAERHVHYCVQPGCKFFNKEAAQGVCHTQEPLRGAHAKVFEEVERMAKEWVDHAKKGKKGKALADYLEGELWCALINQEFTINELIRLRAENSVLRLLAPRKKRRRRP